VLSVLPGCHLRFNQPMVSAELEDQLLLLAKLLDLARSPRASIAWVIALGVYLALELFRIKMGWPPMPSADAGINLDNSITILRHGHYPPAGSVSEPGFLFPYPPPAAVVLGWLGMLLGPARFMIAWVALMIAGFFTTVRAPLAGNRPAERRLWPLAAVIALVATDSPVRWDLCNANSNLIYVGLALLGFALLQRRPALAGVLVGFSLSLKLYSCLLVLWLALHRPRAALCGAVAASLILWLVLPLSAFGIRGAAQVYYSWLQQVQGVARLSAAIAASDPPGAPALITLRHAAETLFGTDRTATVQTLVLALQASWFGLLSFYAWRGLSGGRSEAPSRAALADWTILMLAPLPMSPWLEPHHLVPMIPGQILCALLALDKHAPARDRKLSGVLLASLFLSQFIGLPFAMRGFLVFGRAAALVLSLAILRPSLDKRPMPSMGSGGQGGPGLGALENMDRASA